MFLCIAWLPVYHLWSVLILAWLQGQHARYKCLSLSSSWVMKSPTCSIQGLLFPMCHHGPVTSFGWCVFKPKHCLLHLFMHLQEFDSIACSLFYSLLFLDTAEFFWIPPNKFFNGENAQMFFLDGRFHQPDHFLCPEQKWQCYYSCILLKS